MSDFNVEDYFMQADSLDKAQFNKLDVPVEGYPGMKRFNEDGIETDEYILRNITDGKIERGFGGNYTVTGTDDKGEPVTAKTSYGTMLPRDAYYLNEHDKLFQGADPEFRMNVQIARQAYGNKPRFDQDGHYVSPSSLASFYTSKMNQLKDDFGGQIDFKRNFEGMINHAFKTERVGEKDIVRSMTGE